jgi:hypothetical protein
VRNRLGLATRPRRRPGFVAFPVAGEIVLLAPEGDRAHALNQSGAAIWNLCDGRHTARDMFRELRAQYDGEAVDMLADLTEMLFQFDRLGLIDLTPPRLDGTADADGADSVSTAGDLPRVRFVFGIEEKPCFYWQLAIFFESLVGQLAAGWDITVVVCNDDAELSPELRKLLDLYGVRAITGTNHACSHDIDFAAGRGGYAPLNRVEALKAIAPYVEPDDVVCLMDTDLFLCGNLNAELFPAGNAMAFSEIMADPLFMGFGSRERGIDLQKLLGALGCDRPLARGAVTVFLTGATLQDEKVIRDCFRFAQVLYLLGRVAALPEHNLWIAEMACFAMALTANAIDYELLDTPQFAVPRAQEASVPDGTFFHYYTDVNDGRGGPFAGSEWNKQLFYDRDFLAEDLESFRAVAQGDVERRFLDCAIAARRRRDEAGPI